MIESLLKKHIQLLGNSVLLAEADDIPFKNKYFDMSISYSVFHYFPDKKYFRDVMDELMRVTKTRIFIGDVPFVSHDVHHLTYTLHDFEQYSGIFSSKGCSNKNRFSVMIDVGGRLNGINQTEKENKKGKKEL
jgi:ubiquinone/menaquinone biosynthesis C-methylase UbiE